MGEGGESAQLSVHGLEDGWVIVLRVACICLYLSLCFWDCDWVGWLQFAGDGAHVL